MEMTDRKREILRAIIDDYILTGIPVGSRTLSKRTDMNVSPATIRNEMADLEEGGFLEQPHTSAGRMPSDKAYRLYVDTLMRVSKLSQQEARLVEKYFASKMGELEGVISNTAKALSELTHLTSMVMAPQLAKVDIKRIQVVRITQQRALILFVLGTGVVKEVFIQIPADLDNAYLEMISNVLTEKVRDLPLHMALDTIQEELAGEMAVHRDFMGELIDAVRKNSTASKELVLVGAPNIFDHPEYRDVDKAKQFLSLLETRETLYDILMDTGDMEFSIRIGRENKQDALANMSLVTATYKVGDKTLGSFGVIGPTRMNYARVVSVMNHVGQSMSVILRGMLEPDKK